MTEQRKPWMHSDTMRRAAETDPWIEPKSGVHGIVLLPHGPLPVCDTWAVELSSTVETRPHAHLSQDLLGEVAIPMS